MNCPHCQKELPLNNETAFCPFCGLTLSTVAADPPQPQPPASKIKPLVFLIGLLAPAILTILAVSLGAKEGNTAPTIAMLCGTVGGIVCGIILGWQVEKSTPTRIVLSIVFSAIMSVVCIGMSCFGCLASGFHLDIR
jgi:hypothetical protein